MKISRPLMKISRPYRKFHGLTPLTSYFSLLTSHFSLLTMDSLPEKDPTLVSLVTPRLGVGSATSVGCFLLSLSYFAPTRPTNTNP